MKSKYLRVEHIGNMNKLKDTINYVYKEIIPKNNILVENRQFVYFEKYDSREQAREREKFLKSGQGRNFILSILQK